MIILLFVSCSVLCQNIGWVSWYSHDGNGTEYSGSKSDLIKNILAGADVKVLLDLDPYGHYDGGSWKQPYLKTCDEIQIFQMEVICRFSETAIYSTASSDTAMVLGDFSTTGDISWNFAVSQKQNWSGGWAVEKTITNKKSGGVWYVRVYEDLKPCEVPSGQIQHFALKECPSGWSPFHHIVTDPIKCDEENCTYKVCKKD